MSFASTVSLLKYLQQLGVGQAKTMSQKVLSGSPTCLVEVQALCASTGPHQQEAGSEMEQELIPGTPNTACEQALV